MNGNDGINDCLDDIDLNQLSDIMSQSSIHGTPQRDEIAYLIDDIEISDSIRNQNGKTLSPDDDGSKSSKQMLQSGGRSCKLPPKVF